MKYTTAILSGLMAATVVAQPHVRHQHAAKHEKRDVAWVTELEMVTETIDYTTTVWVSAGQLAAATTSVAPSVTPTTLATKPKSSVASTTSIPKSTAAASSSEGAVLNEQPSSSYVAPSSSSSSYVAAPSTTQTSAVVVPTTSSTSIASVVVPTTSSVASVVVPSSSSSTVAAVVIPTSVSVPSVAIPTSTSIEAVVVPSSTSAAAVYVASSTSAAAAVATSASSSSSGSTSGVCPSGSPCSGDITFYEAGLGACGETTDGSSFAGVALPVGLMGSLSNSNPYCGKTITIKCTTTGKTVQATVIDKCMGCVGNSIDLTNFAFDQLAEEAVGRTTATWYFNE